MAENPDGTLKHVAATGKDSAVDNELRKIANKGQSRQHRILDAFPAAADGEIGEVWIVNHTTGVYICVKVDSSTWNKVKTQAV